jgi:hypothetical protein
MLSDIAEHSSRAVWGVGLDRLYTGIVSSNPAHVMNVCPHLSVLWCPIHLQALCRVDPPRHEILANVEWLIMSEVILNWNSLQNLIPKS